jgi:predicted Fe-S protein YdhL (DUF1289 family)|tara:strand:+ start:10999 stop:11400 length:402 start_codon:yes stop_codon:yes gene_type:complete
MSNLQEVLGEPTTLSDSPCIGRCSTTWGDDICKGCGRSNKQIREWPSYTSLEKKLINLSLAKKFQAKKKMSDKKHPIKELDNKILAAQCLIEMVGSELLELYGKDPKIKNTYQNLFSAVQSLKESKKNLPVDI